MKILGGEFKSRNITVPREVRPVSLRVKKACFDILRGELEGKKVLDLFAGSGSLGLEAISRGANEAVFIDSNPRCIAVVRKNISSFAIDHKSRTYVKNALQAIKSFSVRKEQFDIIFLDPPYYRGEIRKTLQALEEYDIVANSGYVVAFCYWKDEALEQSEKFTIIVDKKYGQTIILIYKK
jgi:16S rRNA (guanine966-N2)-methyltransferase